MGLRRIRIEAMLMSPKCLCISALLLTECADRPRSSSLFTYGLFQLFRCSLAIALARAFVSKRGDRRRTRANVRW